MLSNLGMDTGNFGIVFALLTIIQGIACQRQYAVERKTKNKTLTWTGLSFTAIFIIIGVLGISGIESTLLISLIVLLLVIQKIIEGTYQISIKKYMVNFTTPSTITSVLTSNTLFNNIGTSLVMLFGAFVLDNVDMNYGYIFVGFTGFVVMLFIIAFMKTRVGLKPEEYKEYTAEETENPA
jgi:sugar phosphate permease